MSVIKRYFELNRRYPEILAERSPVSRKGVKHKTDKLLGIRWCHEE